ncbi:MAG: hypothetical protein H2212_03695 [Ruminococcus sp.]|nr:hypothetical protein [Ruminococcus sp.]
MRITENHIIDVLQHKQEKEVAIRQQMQQFLDEISHIESAEYEYDMLQAISLKGKSFDSVKISRTNKTTDTYQILEKFRMQQQEEKDIYKKRLEEKMEELLQMESIWRIYSGLDFRLFQILRLRYVESQKWQVISEELNLSNRQITDWTEIAIHAIMYELSNGEGTSRNSDFTDNTIYKKVTSTKKTEKETEKKNRNVPGQMQLSELGMKGE